MFNIQKSILFVFLTYISSLSSIYAGQIVGYIDRIDNGVIHGWTCDTKVGRSTNVHFYSSDSNNKKRFIKSVKANQKSESAISKICGTRNVSHRFTHKLSSSEMKAFGGHKLYAYGISLSRNKNNSLSRSGNFTIPKAQVVKKVLFEDLNFRAGFDFKNTPIPAQSSRAGTTEAKIPKYLQSSKYFYEDPKWEVAQWYTNGMVKTSGSKSGNEYVWANSYKALKVDLKNNILTFAINSNNDYKGKYRSKNDPWVHLLISQTTSNKSDPIDQLDKLQFKMKARLAYEKEIIKKGHNKNIHAQQFLAYFTIQNLNKKSNGYGQYIWIGIPFHDSRYDFTKGALHVDKGTNSLIYNLSFSDLSKVSMKSKKWVNIDYDILPHVKKALQYGFSNNILKNKNISDYKIGYMNMGFETTGLFISTVQVKDFQLIQYK